LAFPGTCKVARTPLAATAVTVATAWQPLVLMGVSKRAVKRPVLEARTILTDFWASIRSVTVTLPAGKPLPPTVVGVASQIRAALRVP
jgi:hypothetical protein